jgi:hypothetical protein
MPDAPRPTRNQQLRHDLMTSLTVMQIHAQLLERRLRGMDGFSATDRRRLDTGLAAIVAAARVQAAAIERWAERWHAPD